LYSKGVSQQFVERSNPSGNPTQLLHLPVGPLLICYSGECRDTASAGGERCVLQGKTPMWRLLVVGVVCVRGGGRKKE